MGRGNEQSQSTNTEQLRIDADQLRTNNTINPEDRKVEWFRNESANETNFNSECGGKSDEEELDREAEESRSEKEAVSKTQSKEIQ